MRYPSFKTRLQSNSQIWSLLSILVFKHLKWQSMMIKRPILLSHFLKHLKQSKKQPPKLLQIQWNKYPYQRAKLLCLLKNQVNQTSKTQLICYCNSKRTVCSPRRRTIPLFRYRVSPCRQMTLIKVLRSKIQNLLIALTQVKIKMSNN